MKDRFLLIATAILTAGLLIAPTVRAQDSPSEQPDGPPQQDQPQGQPQASGPVGRISVVQGQVSTMHGDGTGSATATVNTPIILGDKISTADRSRAEIQLDPANILRLDQRTEAQVADLQATKINIQLASGLIDYSALQGTQTDVEVDTPNMGVHPLAPGVYRIQVNSDSETMFIVREGEAEVLTNDGSTKVEAGQMIQIHGTDHPEYKIDSASGDDDFDKWCLDRDGQMTKMRASVPTPQEEPPYVGDSDLNTYGQWSEVPDQGWCWTPSVDAGWVPYTYGHWGYEPGWGWTWISLEPWGWAPYHYGSWFVFGGRWLWRPDRGVIGFGGRGAFYGGRAYGEGMRFSARGFVNGQPGGRLPSYAMRSNFAGSGGRTNFGGSVNTWHGYSQGSAFSHTSVGGYGTNARSWQRYSSPSPYSGRQSYSSAPRSYYGGGYGGGSRPPLELNRPIMRQRAPSSGYYGGASYGGNRSYSTQSGAYAGGRSYSAPTGRPSPSGGSNGGGRQAPAGGGRSSGGGGHPSGGGGHGGGHR
jgi:hypothetical protein